MLSSARRPLVPGVDTFTQARAGEDHDARDARAVRRAADWLSEHVAVAPKAGAAPPSKVVLVTAEEGQRVRRGDAAARSPHASPPAAARHALRGD